MVMRHDPKDFIINKGGDADYVRNLTALYSGRAKAGKLDFKNDFQLQRGAYKLAAVVDESVSDKPLVLNGRYIDLFDPELPVMQSVTVNPGSQSLLIDLDKVKDRKRAQVLAASFRESDETRNGNSYAFTAKSPVETDGVSRVLLPAMPKSVTVDGKQVFNPQDWDNASRTYLLKFENSPEGRKVRFNW